MRYHDENSTYADVSTCQSHCTDDPQCLIVVYVLDNSRCFLKKVTPQDFPKDWKEDPGVDTYQRTCN